MGKVKSGKKIYESLSKVVKGLDKADAEKILAKIDTPEEAVALTGDARAEYLKALDTVYGPSDVRSKNIGFGDETWYHGGPENLQYLRPSGATQEIGEGVYLASSKKAAKGFAPQGVAPYELRVKGDSLNLGAWPEDREAVNKVLKKGGMSESDIHALYEEGHINPNNPDSDKVARFQQAKEILEKKGYSGIESFFDDGAQRTVFDSSQLRSTNAAFDPRFKNSPLLMAGTAGAVMGTTMLPEESEASMGKFNSLKKMWQVGDKAFPAANAAEALKVQKAMETKGMVPHGKVLVEAEGAAPVANKPISNMARGIAAPGALGTNITTGSDVLKSGMQSALDAFGAYRQHIVEPIADKLKQTLTPDINIQGKQYQTSNPISDMALDIAADPLTYVGGGAGAGLGALDMATSFGEESPKQKYEGLKAILNKK